MLSRLVAVLFFFAAATFTEVAYSAELSQEAAAAFKTGDFNGAREKLLTALDQNPYDPGLLYNLGLTAFKQGRTGAAIGLWRQGLHTDPTDTALEGAVAWAITKLPKKEIARNFVWWESWRSEVLMRVSPTLVVLLSGVLLMISGWRLVRWWGQRHRAIDEELPMPPLPIGGIAIGCVFLLMFVISLSLLVDRFDVRATVLPVKLEVLSAADSSATVLFEAFEGMEVILREERVVGTETWRQISYPGGLSGWVPGASVLATTDPSRKAFTEGNAP